MKSSAAVTSSDLSLIGEIPGTWRKVRLGQVASVRVSNVDKHTVNGQPIVQLCNYVDVYKNDVISDQLEFMSATATSEQVARFALARGDTVLTKDSETADDIGVPAFIDTDGLVCGYHLAIARPQRGVIAPKFLYYALRSRPSATYWSLVASGVTRVGLRSADIPKVPVALPLLAEQERVIGYLDRETARIDDLIAEHEGLVASMTERRRAVVTHVLTNEATNRVETRLKRIAKTQTGLTLGSSPDEGVEVPYLTVANVQAGRLALDDIKTVRISPREFERHALRTGDVLMTEGGDLDKLGRGAIWHGSIEPCLHQNHVFAVRPGPALDRKFLTYWMDGLPARQYFRDQAKKTTNLAAINSTILGMLPISLPSVVDQESIVAILDQATSRIDHMTDECRALIALLKERRAALITAAVTGQIDVRGEVDRRNACDG